MLEAIRKRAASVVVKLLFVVLVLSFVIWGVADVFRPGHQASWAAKVGDQTITPQAFSEEYRATLRNLGQAIGQPIDAERAKALGLPMTVLNRMIDRTLLSQAATDLGIAINDDVIRNAIRADPRFHGSDGKFDRARFESTLQNFGLTEAGYVAILRDQLRLDAVTSSLTAGVDVPSTEVNALYRLNNEERVAGYIRIDDSAITLPPVPDDATLRAYHQEHADLFTRPESRTVSAIILSADEIARQTHISDADIEAAYKERIAEYSEPERRSFQQMVFRDRAAAEAAQAKIAAGSDFAAVAAETLKLKPADLRFDDLTRQQLPEEIGSVVFSLPEHGRAGPVETPLGWYLIQLTGIKPARERPLSEVHDEIASQLAHERAVDAQIALGNKLQDVLARGTKLADAANELGLTLREIPAIDESGRDENGRAIADLPDRFAETAFATSQGTESNLVDASNDIQFVVEVDAIHPAEIQDFDQVRDRVIKAWMSSERLKALKAKADSLAAQITSPADLTRVAADAKLSVLTTPAIKRDDRGGKDVPPELVRAVFATPTDKTIVIPAGNIYIVARIENVTVPDPKDATNQLAAIRDEVQPVIADDLVRQYLDALRQRHNVSINPNAIDLVS